MFALALASLLAPPPSGATWTVTLRPAVVVAEEIPAPSLELPEGLEEPAPPVVEAPRLAPAKSLPQKPKTRKGSAATQGKRQGR